MDLKVDNSDFWYSLHGQVPGLLDWDMGNELFLLCTTDQSSLAEQNLSKYKIRVLTPPNVPLERKSSPDEDGPHIEPNLWMWVNPNIVSPLSNQESPNPSINKAVTNMPSSTLPPREDEESNRAEAQEVVMSLPLSSSEQKPSTSSLSSCELIEVEAEKQEDKSPVALKTYNKRDCLRRRKVWQAKDQESKSWSRPPLNYSHLIALALKNSSPHGLNVQQIYNFIRKHFPFFQTASDSWKNTIRHNLCFLANFEKVTCHGEADPKPHSCLWRLTEEGHRHFQEDTRLLASAHRESIKQCMSQPDLMPTLFGL